MAEGVTKVAQAARFTDTDMVLGLQFWILVTDADCSLVPAHECEQEQHRGTDQNRGHCRSINASQQLAANNNCICRQRQRSGIHRGRVYHYL